MNAIIFRKKDHVGLALDNEALKKVALLPSQLRGTRKTLKRLVRIRRNVIRELKALNKELNRHRYEDLFK